MAHANRLYKVGMDWWVLLPAAVVLLALLGIIPIVYVDQFGAAWFQVSVTVILVLFILYLVDSIFFTYYQLTDEGLVVVSQLRHYLFPYRSMKSVKPVGLRGLVSFGRHKRFALSLHAYEITVADSDWTTITISPVDRDRFMNVLMERVDKERSSRATK